MLSASSRRVLQCVQEPDWLIGRPCRFVRPFSIAQCRQHQFNSVKPDPTADPPGADSDDLQRLWQLCCLDTAQAQALALGEQIAAAGGADAAWGWMHVALAHARTGERQASERANQRARQFFADDPKGLAWCDEITAITLRRTGDYQGSADLQRDIDQRQGFERSQLMLFMAHNSRAITHKLLGHADETLRHFYAALRAATATGWTGPRITALCNLGGIHQDLFNLDDACAISEQALHAMQRSGSYTAWVHTCANLILTYHAMGEPDKARAMVEQLLTKTPPSLMPLLRGFHPYLALGHLGVAEVDAAMAYLDSGPAETLDDGDGQAMWAWLRARSLLAQDKAPAARAVAEAAVRERQLAGHAEAPYTEMQLTRVLSDACEACGDPAAALRYLRHSQQRYEQLVGRSARARFIALEFTHQLNEMQRQRDLAVSSRRSAESDREKLESLNQALRKQVAETEMLHARLREQALRDPLTGLHNRRYLFETAPGLLELARRQNTHLCVVLLDLDHFKLLNDTYSHQAGDMVLQRFSQLLTNMLRRSDVICRHGGEEFVAVMPDIDSDGAEAMLERLLQAVQSQRYELGGRRIPSGSFSAGIARFPRHGQTLEQLLSRADRALYAAKNQGRARIEQAPRTGFGSLV